MFPRAGLEAKLSCPVRAGGRQALPVEMAPTFQFATSIVATADLNILVMGDSVALQLAKAVQAAAGVDTNTIQTLRAGGPQLVTVGRGGGGGLVAGSRLTGMLLEQGRGMPLPPWTPNRRMYKGGWWPEHVDWLLNRTATFAPGGAAVTTGENNNNNNKKPMHGT